MGLGGLQHYTIEPSDLERTKDFYCDVLGLENGDRPPLDFPGYWLYSGGSATVPRPHRLCGDRCRGHAQAPAVEGRQIPREHRAAHRRYAVLPLRPRWRRRRTELSESLRLAAVSGPAQFGRVRTGRISCRCCCAKAHLMLGRNTARQRLKFPTTPQVSHDQGASPSGFLHHCNEIGEAAPLRQSSRVPAPFNLPQGMRTRLFVRRSPLVEPALVAQIDHFLNKDRLLLVVQAGK